jgi:arylsulfatase A-like enzyme
MTHTLVARRALMLSLFALLVGPAVGLSRSQENILLLIADDLGVDAIEAYGEGTDLPSTPSLNQLAQTGVLFKRAYGCPSCSPTRASIQTGRYAFRTGIGEVVWINNQALPLSETTLPEMLDLGTGGLYAHAALGKWHLGNDPVGGLLSPNLAGYGSFRGTLFGIVPPESYYDWTKVVDGVSLAAHKYATTEEIDDAVAWIATAPEPWFLCVGLHAPHSPFHVPPPALATLEPSDAKDSLRPYYKAMVEAMDTEIGRLLASIPPAVRDQTMVIMTSDNGTQGQIVAPPFNPNKVKRTIYEGGIRLPLIVSGPLVVQPGRQSNALVNTTDLFATVAEIAGANLAGISLPTLDSVSILPYLVDPAQKQIRKTVYSEHFEPNGFAPNTWTRAMRNNAFKLILRSDLTEEFYHLTVDPLETNPLPIGNLTSVHRANYLDLKERIMALVQTP